MKKLNDNPKNIDAYFRLVALWVVCEAFVGGIIHGIKLPISGIIIGSAAVICISLIGYYFPDKGMILKATIIVTIFKMMLSPQSPPMAYVAVFFQGVVGELCFFNKKYFTASSFFFALIALIESGLQRIIILTFVYGKNFWTVADETIGKVFQLKSNTHISIYIALFYLLAHLIIGVVAWLFVLQIVKKSSHWKIQLQNFIISDPVLEGDQSENGKKKKRVFTFLLFILIYIILILLLVQSYGYFGKPFFKEQIIIGILLRSSIILLTWKLVVSPIMKKSIHHWLRRKKRIFQNDIESVIVLLPATKNILSQSWKMAAVSHGWKKISLCCKIIIINILHTDDRK